MLFLSFLRFFIYIYSITTLKTLPPFAFIWPLLIVFYKRLEISFMTCELSGYKSWIGFMECEPSNYKSHIGLMSCELSNYKSWTSFMLNYELLPTCYKLFLYYDLFPQVPCSIMRIFQLVIKFIFNYEFFPNLLMRSQFPSNGLPTWHGHDTSRGSFINHNEKDVLPQYSHFDLKIVLVGNLMI
jgi:hypothetical protein